MIIYDKKNALALHVARGNTCNNNSKKGLLSFFFILLLLLSFSLLLLLINYIIILGIQYTHQHTFLIFTSSSSNPIS